MGLVKTLILTSNNVKSVHGYVYVIFQHTLQRGDSVLNRPGNKRLLILAEPAQHVGNGVSAVGRLAYTDSQTRELF